MRVRLAGVCSTDLQILKGYTAFEGVPSHDFVGEIHAGPRELMGRRVVGEINFACGTCEPGLRGMAWRCIARRVKLWAFLAQTGALPNTGRCLSPIFTLSRARSLMKKSSLLSRSPSRLKSWNKYMSNPEHKPLSLAMGSWV